MTARQGQVDMGRRDRLADQKPLRVESVLVCCGQARHGPFELATGAIEFAAQPRHHPELGLDHRTEPLPPLLETGAATSSTWVARRRSARAT